jgi:hypothetical protein
LASIHKGERPTTAEQKPRYRETHDGLLAETTVSQRMYRGGGGDGVSGAPSMTEVLDMAKDDEKFWGQLHGEQEIDHIKFRLLQTINVPEGYNRVRPSTGNSVVMTLADHVAGDMPQTKVPEANLTKVAERRSEKIEKFLQASHARFLSAEPVNQVRTMAINFGWAGMAVSQGPIFIPDVWGTTPERGSFESAEEYEDAMAEYEATKKMKWPFWWRMIDPRFAYPDPGTIGKEHVIIQYERIAASIRAQWPEWTGYRTGTTTKLANSQRVHWVEYWDTSYRMYIAGGEELDTSKHPYGKPQFQIRAAGFGDDTGEPHERFQSLLYPARSLLDQEIRCLTQLDAVMRQAAWSTVLTPENSGLKAIVPGEVQYLKREDIAATRPFTEVRGEVVQALLAEHDIISQGIEDATFPSVVKGVRAKGVGSGYGQNSLAALGKIKFGSVAVACQTLLQEFNEDYLRCVERVVGESVPVWGQTEQGFIDFEIKPEDIAGYYYNIVTLNPKLPIDRANEIQIGSVLYNNGQGVIDAATYLSDFGGYEQPDELRVKVLRDQVMRLPQIQQILMIAALEETGMLDYVLQKAREFGMDPLAMMQALGLIQPPSPPPQGPGGAIPPAGSLTGAAPNGGGVPRMQPGPSAQAEPMPGGLNSQPMTPTQAAQGAGVAPPGFGR